MSRMSAAARESRKTCRLNQRVTRGPICSVSSARSSAVSRRTALAYAQGAQLQREQESYPCQSKGNAQEAGEELRGPPPAQRLERASLRALPEDDEQQDKCHARWRSRLRATSLRAAGAPVGEFRASSKKLPTKEQTANRGDTECIAAGEPVGKEGAARDWSHRHQPGGPRGESLGADPKSKKRF